MNVLSLFDGISVGRLALEHIGVQVHQYFASEIDPHAKQVAAINWPSTTHVGDVTKLEAGGLPQIDLMFAGFPCQSISSLGKGAGLKGKSGLFWEFIRLKEELNPRYWLVENVDGLKSAIDKVTETLGVQPIRICSSRLTGQNRARLYWTNIPGVTQPEDAGVFLRDVLEQGVPDLSALTPGRKRWVLSEKGRQCFSRRYASLDPVKAQCLTARSDASWNSNYVTRQGSISRLTPVEYERLQGLPDNYTACIRTTERYKSIGNSWTMPVIAHILRPLGNYDPTRASS